jgi:acetyl esterase
MTTSLLTRYEIDVKDVEYLRHGNKPLMARIYQPRGDGPFPLMIDLHGGAWCRGDRLDDTPLNEPLAKSGVVVAALDFRQPPDAGYAGAMADINYAIRWLKARAGELKSRPDRVGIMGISSGGQQAMLGAMRHADPRYMSIPLAGRSDLDASVRAVVLCWPVIDPLGRYEYAKKLIAEGSPHAEMAERWLPSHDQYWGSEAAQAEGSPTRALERGERGATPPVLYLQGTADLAHPRPNLDRFVEHYRKIGGRVELKLFEGVGEAFVKKDPTLPASIECIDAIVAFAHRELGA